jgi:hypothetical protein
MWGRRGEIETQVSENKSPPEVTHQLLNGSSEDSHQKKFREKSLSREEVMTYDSNEGSVETHSASPSLSNTTAAPINIPESANEKNKGNGTLNPSQTPQQISQNMLDPAQRETTNSAPMETDTKATLPKETAALPKVQTQQILRTGNSNRRQNLFSRTSYTAVAKLIKTSSKAKETPYSRRKNSKTYREIKPNENESLEKSAPIIRPKGSGGENDER